MKTLLLGGLAAGALTVLLVTSKMGVSVTNQIVNWLPECLKNKVGYLLSCTFCTSWWISLAMLEKFSIAEWAATVAVANIVVLLIHWSLASVEQDNEVV